MTAMFHHVCSWSLTAMTQILEGSKRQSRTCCRLTQTSVTSPFDCTIDRLIFSLHLIAWLFGLLINLVLHQIVSEEVMVGTEITGGGEKGDYTWLHNAALSPPVMEAVFYFYFCFYNFSKIHFLSISGIHMNTKLIGTEKKKTRIVRTVFKHVDMYTVYKHQAYT